MIYLVFSTHELSPFYVCKALNDDCCKMYLIIKVWFDFIKFVDLSVISLIPNTCT